MTSLRNSTWIVLALAGALIAAAPVSAHAQDTSAGGDELEGLFNKDEQQSLEMKPDAATPHQGNANAPGTTGNNNGGNAYTGTSSASGPQMKDISDLGKLSDFDDIAVIQKRYQPKTGRFEFYISPTLVLNDAFFLNFGADARLSYSFTERYAVEFTGIYLSTSERGVTQELRDNRGVITTSLVSPHSFYGLDFRYTPVYGKMAFANEKITPFDLYFSLGLGMTGTNQGSTEPTLHLGTGQTFARTKGTAYRWDFSWNMFTAQPYGQTNRSFYNSLFISVGFSWLFPEATYR